METQPKEYSPRDVEIALTNGALSDLQTLLGTIKGRTTFLANNISPESPLQLHFKNMIKELNESLETAAFLKDSFELDILAE
jgi:hypothetical protein